MKKSFLLALLASTCFSLVGCDEEKEELGPYSDQDFDGIYDNVDPDRKDNKVRYVFGDGISNSNEIVIPVDYRNFIYDDKPTYNKYLAQMAAIIANYSYRGLDKNWTVSKNEYITEESKINKGLVQFGFNNLKYVKVEAGKFDPYDRCGLYLGNHIFLNEEKKYQVIVASVEGYLNQEMWYSNFDIGYDGESYYSIYGEHPEWTNKKNHKGFDVTANRAFPVIENYMNEVNEESINEQIVLVTGHSRGASISNLLGKLLKDRNIKSIVYAFNGCRTTDEQDQNVLKSYSNIFNVDSLNDYVCRYPFSFMNFTSYGNIVTYDLVAENDYYKSIYGTDFIGNSDENLNEITKGAENVFKSRKDMYDYLPVDSDFPEFVLCSSLENANKTVEMLEEEIEDSNIEGFAYCEVSENEDIETSVTYPYRVSYFTRPACILSFAAQLVINYNYGGGIKGIFEDINRANRFISKYLDKFLEVAEVELNIYAFANPHLQKTCVLGAYVAK